MTLMRVMSLFAILGLAFLAHSGDAVAAGKVGAKCKIQDGADKGKSGVHDAGGECKMKPPKATTARGGGTPASTKPYSDRDDGGGKGY